MNLKIKPLNENNDINNLNKDSIKFASYFYSIIFNFIFLYYIVNNYEVNQLYKKFQKLLNSTNRNKRNLKLSGEKMIEALKLYPLPLFEHIFQFHGIFLVY